MIVCRPLITLCLFHLAAASLVASMAQAPAASASTSVPVPITLDEALTRARANEPTFAAAAAATRVAALDRSIARSALLPQAVAHNQFLYTQGGAGYIVDPVRAGEPALAASSAPRFIANNAVHEYISQASVTETVGPQQFNALTRATTSLSIAIAEQEIARRGLTSAVVGLFYNSLAAGRKVEVAQRAANEAAGFTRLTQQRETAREVAHADVVKAQLLEQQRNRDLADAKLLADRSRLDLAVLLFPDPRSPYIIVIPSTPPAPPARAEVEAALARHNPELQSALSGARLADLNVTSARLAYLPDLALNYTYGLDAGQLAYSNILGDRNLGYSASATVDLPLWDWFATRNRVRQQQILRTTAQTVLSNTQRRLIANLEQFLSEANVAHDQLDSLNLSATTAAESLRLTRLRYTAGEATVLEVVDAQTSLANAENAREDGLTRYQTALANLQLLTGTL